MWVLRSFLILVIIAVVVGFAYFNGGADQQVRINMVWWVQQDVPLTTVVFWAFVIGAVVSWLLFISVYLKQSRQIRDNRRQVKGLQTEVTALRNRPIEESKNLLDKSSGLQE